LKELEKDSGNAGHKLFGEDMELNCITNKNVSMEKTEGK
jgi:hypothetical protein